MKFIIEKLILRKINSLLSQYNDNVDKVKNTLTIWIMRLKVIIDTFERLIKRLDDNNLSKEEIDDTKEDIKQLIKSF